ncbi:protein disulfide oxidoreductase [Shewanella sp. HN-41]|uniref:protein disulfide oxidoreductase n=1 Tax=Shewanella sp. HN-41 TaxID=327275 RepID=UPI0002125CB7|nr:protein disulfide oxidoreductase [Shewanella sp. HN-41]EGM69364.1 membrane protein, suppressor for copper-sensitivity ScsD [Shewanella sp. HN-41]
MTPANSTAKPAPPKGWSQKLRSPRFWLKQLRDLAIMALVLYGVSRYLQRDMVTGQAPALSGIAIDGSHLALNTTQTEPTLVYFWGTWCPVCRVTSPMIETVGQDHRVISVAVASGSDSEIQRFMDEHEYHFPVLNDDSGEQSTQWGAMAFPAIYIIDTQGNIRYVTSGVTSSWGMKFRLWLAQF